jgi:hypothetical protein
MVSFLMHGLVDNSYFVFDLAYLFCFALALITRSSSNKAEISTVLAPAQLEADLSST